jgi:hypothetical protein
MSVTHFTFSEAESSLSTSSSAYTLHLSKCALGCTGYDDKILRVFFGPFTARLVLEFARRANLKKLMKYIGREGILKVFTLYHWEQQHMASIFCNSFNGLKINHRHVLIPTMIFLVQ